MSNYFDQYDEPAPDTPAAGNYFDRYDPPAAPPAQAASANYFDRYDPSPPPPQEPVPEAQGQFMSGVRQFVHDLPGALGGAAGGALVGGAAGAAGGNPLTAIGGALAGGLAGGFIGEAAKDAGLKLLGMSDSEALQLAVNAKAHPVTTTLAGAGTAVAGGTLGAVGKGVRALSGGIGGAFETGRQLYQGEELDPLKIGATAAGGTLFAKNYGWMDKLAAQGGTLGAHWRDRPRAQPHGSAGPEANASTAAEPVPVTKTPDVGFEHPIGVGSEKDYSIPRDSAAGEKAGVTVKQPGELDPALKAAVDAENPPVQPETPPPAAETPPPAAAAQAVPPPTEQPQGVSRLNAPVAEIPQGRMVGEQPTPPVAPEGTATPRDFWSYQAPEPPKVGELPEGAIKPGTTQAEFEQLSPGMRREVARSPEQSTPQPADDLEIPAFLDRRAKPPTVAEEPAPPVGREIAPAAEKGPLYPHAAMKRPKLEAELKKAEAESSKVVDEMIEAGRGREQPSETRNQTDDLSRRYMETADRVQSLHEEIKRREKYHGKRTPIPGDARDTFYGGPLRQDVIERGRSGRPIETERLPIGTEPQILEAGAAKAIGPKGEPREPEMLAARRKGGKPVDWDNLGLTKDAEGNWQGTVRLYRGEKPDGTAAIPGSEMGGGWYTTNLAKAQKYGEVKVLDVDANDLKKFMQGHGGKDEFLAGQNIDEFRARSKPLAEAPDAAIDATVAAATAPSAARGQPMPLTATGGGAGTPPGAPPIPPNAGTAAAAGAGGGPPGGGPATPNPAHIPQQQQGFFKQLWRDIQRKTAAHLLGPEGMEARYLIRSSYGPTQRVAEQTASMLKDHTDMIRAMPDADRRAMINTMQGDNRIPFQPTPEQRTFMGKFERMMQEWEAQLHQLDATEQMKFRKDFMAQMYENPTAAPDMFTGMGKRGSAGSTKARKHETYLDAENAGLQMKTTDPIEIGVRYANSIKDFVASRNLIQRGEATDRIGYFSHEKVVGASGSPEPLVTGGPPPGWKKLDGVSKNGKDGYAPADFADVYNNFMDKGYRGGKDKGNVYDAVRNSTNAWTQLELGINAYHLFTMANEAIISDVGGALNKAFRGDLAGAGQKLKAAPMAWRTRAIEGAKFQQDYLDPNSTNPIAAIVAEANGRPIGRGHAADYSFQERGSFINKWSTSAIQSELRQAGKEVSEDFAKAMAGTAGQKALFPLQQAGRALQTVAAPIFDKYIPMLKAGAVQGQMKDWHEAMIAKNPAFDMVNNPADRRTAVNAAMKIVDSVDNRFGEMIHDNMFMNATLKQSAQVGMRSFSWAIGAIKEIGGGTAATGKALYQLGKTRGAENRFDMTHPEWDPRMAYAIAFPFVVGTISTMYQYLRAGEGPEGWRDLYAPKTGGMVPGVGGKGMVKEHVLMPGYQKDVLGWIHHPVQEAYNKLGGLPTTAIEQVSGKDWRGDPIVRAGATLPEAAGQRMMHVFGKLSPISVKNMTKGTEPGSAITTPERLLGFRAPGAHIQDPEGLHRAMDRRDRRIQKAIDKRERKIQLRQNPQQAAP